MSEFATVEQGEIVVSSVYLDIDKPDVRVWVVDFASKYAQTLGYAGTTVHFSATEESIKVDESKRGQSTKITFELPDPKNWDLIADCVTRYTCRVVAWKTD
jgi:hypothetical protein